jgi:hypothetical protein
MDAAAPPAPDGAPGKRAPSPTPPPVEVESGSATAAAGAPDAAATTAASTANPTRAAVLIAADPAAARLASVALHVAPFLPNVLDLLALREATRLPLTRDALCAHLRAVGPSTLVPPRVCAYSRVQHPKAWAAVLTRYVGDWRAAVDGAAISGGIAAVADALDALAHRLFDAAHAHGHDTRQPDAQMRQLGLDYDDNGRPHPASDVAALSPRMARVVALATGAPAAGSSSTGGGGGSGSGGGPLMGGTNASLADPLHGALPLCPLERYDFVHAIENAHDDDNNALLISWTYRRLVAVACLVDASEAATATAAALRLGLTRPEQLPQPLGIGTVAGRDQALRSGLKAAGLARRYDGVLCDAFVTYSCTAPHFAVSCSATATDNDAAALDYVVETLAEMQWLHSAGTQFHDLVTTNNVYHQSYATHYEYSESVRAAKLVATRNYLAECDASFEAGVPRSLLRDLRRVQVEGDSCGDGPVKLTLTIISGEPRDVCSICGEDDHDRHGCSHYPDDRGDDDDYDYDDRWDHVSDRYRSLGRRAGASGGRSRVGDGSDDAK